MITSLRQLRLFLAMMLFAGSLAGCSSINERIGPAIGDNLPHWAGGEPKGIPPRRGTPEYDAYMKEQERKRLEPAPANANASAPAATPALDPVH